MRIVMAGTSGYLGGHLVPRLESEGHEVVRLVRRKPTGPGEIAWNPYETPLDPDVLAGAGAVVNLGGVGVADRRWTQGYKQLIRDSRVIPTRALASAAASAKVPTMVNASAVGWYGGDTGDTAVDESHENGEDFLGRTCREWEAATEPAARAGARVALLRTGPVLASDAPILKPLLPLFRLCLGGRFGSGRQYFPWISLNDWLAAAQFVIAGELAGPVNLVGPTPADNAEFARAFGEALRRPAPFVVPAFALRIVAGEAADELLHGAKVIPKVLNDNGFTFEHSTIAEALRWSVASR